MYWAYLFISLAITACIVLVFTFFADRRIRKNAIKRGKELRTNQLLREMEEKRIAHNNRNDVWARSGSSDNKQVRRV